MTETSTRRRAAAVAVWTITVLLALEFVLAGGGKFFPGPGSVWRREFTGWGLPGWSVPIVGAIEVGAAVLLLIPRVAAMGGVSLAITMAGAATIHAVHGEWRRFVLTSILCVLSSIVARARGAGLRVRGRQAAAVSAALVATVLPARGGHAQATWFIATRGGDTTSIEHFERAGNTITGDWITLANGPLSERPTVVHHYVITLATDGRPRGVTLAVHKPDGSAARTYDARLADDSVVVAISGDTTPPRRIRANRAFPVLGESMGFLELAFMALRAEHRDSTPLEAVPLTGPFTAQRLGVVFSGPDSARIGNSQASLTVHFDRAGRVSAITSPMGTITRVPPFDLDALTKRAAGAAAKP
jgi:uncharacterized membrane protein YphA (DoxX/SURF4 family)